jgi:hypothetical protein
MAPRRYAEGTKVPLEKSVMEINMMIVAMGSTQTMQMQDDKAWTFAFFVDGIGYKLAVPRPDPNSPEFATVKVNGNTTTAMTPEQKRVRIDAELARRMRALAALVKAKKIAIEEGIVTTEAAFMGDIVVDKGGGTLQDQVLPQVKAALDRGQLAGVLALPFGGSKK